MHARKFSRRRFIQLLASGAGALILSPRLSWAGRVPVQAVKSGLAPYSMKLHVHANSNHNAGFNGQPGSLQWHTDMASSLSVNTIWWSEHHQTMFPTTDFVVPLETGTLDPNTLFVNNLADPFPHSHALDADCCIAEQPEGSNSSTWYAENMEALIRGGVTPRAALSGNELTWKVTGGNNGGYFRYAPRNYKHRPVNGHYMPKALLGNVVVTIDVERGDVGDHQLCQIEFDLAWRHIKGTAIQQSVIYNLVAQPGVPVVGNQTVTIPVVVPNPSTWTTLTLQLTNDAQQWLPSGMDNNITDVQFRASADVGYTSSMGIRNFMIHSQQQDGPTNWGTGKGLAVGYEASYPTVTQVYGAEMSLPNSHHLNTFLPSSVNQLADPRLSPAQLVKWVHSLGGMASFNHPFGPAQDIVPNQDQLLQQVLNYLMPLQVYGADLIEIYTRRHEDLQHHLELWDFFTTYGGNLLGFGTDDSHGGPWTEQVANYFVTWTWAAGPDEDSLLAGMKSRLLYFGDPFRFSSASLNYNAGGVNMGGKTTVNSDQTTVNLVLTGGQPNWEQRLRQYQLQQWVPGPSHSLITLVGNPQQPWLVFTGNSVQIQTLVSSFIRIEIWDKNDGMPVAFGQTIVLNRA